MSSSQEVWRWNVDPVWDNYSSMWLESALSLSATNTFEKYHHLRSSLLFGMASIEAFLNQEMRKSMIAAGEQEKEIGKKLKTFLGKKIGAWPQLISGKPLTISTDLEQVVREHNDLRGETAHPQRRDHSFYASLDSLSIIQLTRSIAHYIISVSQALDRPFSYWLLGWNFVGFNHNVAAPCMLGNHQFLHSLRAFGINVPSWDYDAANEWEKANMVTLEGFERLDALMNSLPFEIEPRHEELPEKPRLCKRWWDKQLIKSR